MSNATPTMNRTRNNPATRQILELIAQNTRLAERLAKLPGYVDPVLATENQVPTLAVLIESYMADFLPDGDAIAVMWACTNWQEVAETVRGETATEEQYRVRHVDYDERTGIRSRYQF